MKTWAVFHPCSLFLLFFVFLSLSCLPCRAVMVLFARPWWVHYLLSYLLLFLSSCVAKEDSALRVPLLYPHAHNSVRISCSSSWCCARPCVCVFVHWRRHTAFLSSRSPFFPSWRIISIQQRRTYGFGLRKPNFSLLCVQWRMGELLSANKRRRRRRRVRQYVYGNQTNARTRKHTHPRPAHLGVCG